MVGLAQVVVHCEIDRALLPVLGGCSGVVFQLELLEELIHGRVQLPLTLQFGNGGLVDFHVGGRRVRQGPELGNGRP